MMNSLRPNGITADRNIRQLSIEWNNEHKSIYPFALLRHACPCAECRGGHDKMSSEPDPQVFTFPLDDLPATRIQNLEAVGSYAITITWEDGHHYGIYNWRYLRSLCPCPLCRPINHET